MLDQRYPIDDVRQFLTEAGARILTKQDAEIPFVLASRSGENWLLPVNYKLASHIVVNLGETYPDDPPTFFLPRGYCGHPLIPHVSKAGNVCAIAPNSTVNPDKWREVFEISLKTVESLLNRDWDDLTIFEEIEPELSAYWSLDSRRSVLFFEKYFAQNIVEVAPFDTDKTKYLVKSASQKELPKETGIGLVVSLTREDMLGFLRAPEAFLLESDVLKDSVAKLEEYIGSRNRVLNSIRLFLFVVFELKDGPCVLVGRMPNLIPAKKKHFANFSNAVFACIKAGGIEPCNAENISTHRLIHRTAGSSIPDSLFEKRVAIIGCGSLGSMIADGLLRSGIRNFLLCDADVFRPENLARHVLTSNALFKAKAEGLAFYIKSRLPDAEAQIIAGDIRLAGALSALLNFHPDIVVCATGDTNTDITLSHTIAENNAGPCCFTWVEPNLEAGHLIYQPQGKTTILRQLHPDGRYCHALIKSPVEYLMKESGCQSSFTPYSGLDMVLFSAHVSKRILSWLLESAPEHQILRISKDDGSYWEPLS